MKGKHHTPEARARIAAAQRASWAKGRDTTNYGPKRCTDPAAIIARYQRGQTLRQCAAAAGCTFQRVWQILAANGIERRPPHKHGKRTMTAGDLGLPA